VNIGLDLSSGQVKKQEETPFLSVTHVNIGLELQVREEEELGDTHTWGLKLRLVLGP